MKSNNEKNPINSAEEEKRARIAARSERLRNLALQSQEINDEVEIIYQYKGGISTELSLKISKLGFEDINQIRITLNKLENFTSIPDDIHPILQESFSLAKEAINDFNDKNPNLVGNAFESKVLNALKEVFFNKLQEIAQESTDGEKEQMSSSSLTSTSHESSKRSISDDITTSSSSLPQSESKNLKTDDNKISADRSSPPSTSPNLSGDSPLRKQEQLIEFLGISKEQFERIDSDTRDVMYQNVIPKIELLKNKSSDSASQLNLQSSKQTEGMSY